MTIDSKDPTADMNNLQHFEGQGTYTGKIDNAINNNNGLTSATVTDDKGTVKQRDCEENQEINKIHNGGTSTQMDAQDMKTVAIPSYLTLDCVAIIIMGSSTVDKDTTIRNIQQKGYNALEQRSLKLSSDQIDTLYAYNEADTKPHYRALYDGWKKNSLSDPVEVVILGKENAVQSFQDLMNKQNSTKKKERILDTQSVYASTSQDNVKRDIELLLGTQESNNRGDHVSSATAEENQDDTVTQTPLETEDQSLQKSISTQESTHPSAALSHENSPSDTAVDMATSISNISINKQQRPTVMTMAATTVTSTTMVTATFDVASPIEHQHRTPAPPTSLSPKKNPIVLTSTPLDDQAIENHPLPSPKISPSADKEDDDNNNNQLVRGLTTEINSPQSQVLEQSASKPPANIRLTTDVTKESSPPTTSFKTTTVTEALNESSSLPSAIYSTVESPIVSSMNTITTTETFVVSTEEIVLTTESTTEQQSSSEQSMITKSPPPISSLEESKNADDGKCSNNDSNVSNSPSADNAANVEQQIMDSATKTKSSAKSDVVTRQESRDSVHSKKKQAVGPTAKKVAPAETKTNNTASTQPALPIKSKLRRTATSTTVPATVEKAPNKQQQASSDAVDSSKKPTEEPKKKVPRVPRVALLANQTKSAPAPATNEQKQQKTPATKTTKISRDAIARLTAPTASSSRRQHGASTAPLPPSTPTRGTSVTATFKVEQRKRRPDPVPIVKTTPAVKAATPTVKQPSPTSTSRLAKQALTKKRVNDVGANKKNETPQKAAKKPLASKKREATTAEKSATISDTSTPEAIGSKKAMVIDAEKAVDETSISSTFPAGDSKHAQQDNNKHTKAEQSPLSPADSSTTSSRPQTPDHSTHDRAVADHHTSTTATTTSTSGMVTLNNVNPPSIKTLDHHHHQQKPPVTTSKVKDMLSQFM